MDIQHFGDLSLSASKSKSKQSSRYKGGAKVDSGYDISTKVGDTVAGTDLTSSASKRSARFNEGKKKIDFGYDSSTKSGDTVAGIDSSLQKCELQQPDPAHSDALQNSKTEDFRTKFHCNICLRSFLRADLFERHLRRHRGERPFVCTICSKKFTDQDEKKRHEKIHEYKGWGRFVCRGELSAQPARVWGCGYRFERVEGLVRHFNSRGNVGRGCIMPLLGKEVVENGVFTSPSVLLTQYPELKDFKLVQISASQNAPTEAVSISSSDDSGYTSYLNPLSVLPIPIFQAQTEGPRKAMSYYGSYPSVESQVTPSPPSQNVQDSTDILTPLPDRLETSEDSDDSLLKTIPRVEESDCEDPSRGIELLDIQNDSQGNSDCEGQSSYKVRHVSKKTSFAAERAWNNDGNCHLPDKLSHDQSSSNSGSEDGYDDTSEASVLDCSQRALIARLMDEICSSFFYQISHRPRQHGQGGQGSRESSSSSTAQKVTTNSFIGESPGKQGKRSHKEDEDPEDEDGGKKKRSRNLNSDDGHSARVRYFACPFHKFDASTYSSGNADPRVGLKYRSCGPPGWPNIGKLKEHLYRNHQTPIHCPRCWTIMKTEAALGEHARATNQCDILPPSLRWIPREVCENLKNRKRAFAGQTEEDTWRYIFGLLFPECPIPSPYYNDSITPEGTTQKNSPTSNAIAAYEEYARAHLPRLFEEALETAVAEQMQPIEEGLRRALAGMVRDCQTRLAQDFLRHRSSNLSSTGGAGVQAEVLPSFDIEPLSLAEDVVSINPTQISTDRLDRTQTHSDSGYSSMDTSLNCDSSGHSADLHLQDDMGSSHDSTSHGIDISRSSGLMPWSSDWTALWENNQDNSFFRDGLDDEGLVSWT